MTRQRLPYWRQSEGLAWNVKYLWLRARVNWFTIALHCACKGHTWRDNTVRGVNLKDCAWCGKFGGWSW